MRSPEGDQRGLRSRVARASVKRRASPPSSSLVHSSGEPERSDTTTSLPEQMYLVGLQVTLMEDAFLSLDLDQPVNWNHPGNAGWKKLFTDWAGSDGFTRRR